MAGRAGPPGRLEPARRVGAAARPGADCRRTPAQRARHDRRPAAGHREPARLPGARPQRAVPPGRAGRAATATTSSASWTPRPAGTRTRWADAHGRRTSTSTTTSAPARTPAARAAASIERGSGAAVWRVRQIFDDPAGDHDWGISAEVDLAACDEAGAAVVRVVSVGELPALAVWSALVRLRDALVAQGLRAASGSPRTASRTLERRCGSARGARRAARTRSRTSWTPTAQASRTTRTSPRSIATCRESTDAVVAATSAQSRSRRMQVRIAATSSSARQASVHAVQVAPQASAASMHAKRAPARRKRSGWLVIISATVMPIRYPCGGGSHVGTRLPRKRTADAGGAPSHLRVR